MKGRSEWIGLFIITPTPRREDHTAENDHKAYLRFSWQNNRKGNQKDIRWNGLFFPPAVFPDELYEPAAPQVVRVDTIFVSADLEERLGEPVTHGDDHAATYY